MIIIWEILQTSVDVKKESESSIKDEIIKYLYWTQQTASYVLIDASVFQRG